VPMAAAAAPCEDEVSACAFGAWYEQFRSITYKSEVISLPEEFVRFLLSDGICLATGQDPGGHDSDSSLADEPPPRSRGAGGGRGHGGTQDEEASSSSDEEEEQASFPELELQVAAAIRRLGGKVLPKLNWSAPKDATWLYGSLQCEKPSEIFTMLKASDFVAHDLCHAFDDCGSNATRTRPEAFTLVLRRWHELFEAGEFRCFAAAGSLVGISQRQTLGLYEHLGQQGEVDILQREIRGFFDQHIRGSFPLQRYAFDVHVGAAPQRRMRLVDFSPWSQSTDACLFDWPDLADLADAAAVAAGSLEPTVLSPEFRVVREEADKRAKADRYSQIPLELARLGAGEGVDDFLKKADDFLKQKGSST